MSYPSEGTPIDNDFHPADSNLSATNDHWGTQMADASVTPLHPAGTFSSNTQKGDVINGVAKALGMGPPSNVVKFPKK